MVGGKTTRVVLTSLPEGARVDYAALNEALKKQHPGSYLELKKEGDELVVYIRLV